MQAKKAGRKRPSSRGKDARKVPPFKKAAHQLTHAQARRMRKRFVAIFGTEGEFGQPSVYGRNIFDKILAQPGVYGIRFYPVIGDDGRFSAAFCGVDEKGNDVLKGVIGDTPWRCPPFCSDGNGVLQF